MLLNFDKMFKIYFNGKRFVADPNPQSVCNVPLDSDIRFFFALENAEMACDENNTRIESGDIRIEKCKCCSNYFIMDRREMNWYRELGYQFPKRCLACRKNKQLNESNNK